MKRSEDQTSDDVNGPVPPGTSGPNRGAIRIGAGSLVGDAVRMSLFTRMLSQRMDRMVVDNTGLTGRYDLHLQWTPGLGEMSNDPGGTQMQSSNTLGPSVFTAIQEQLGLKLESTKAPIDILVIQHMEKPTEN